MARRRRSGRRMPAGLKRYWASHRRRRRSNPNPNPPRARRRRSYGRNAPRRRARRRVGMAGLPNLRGLMPVVGTGVAAGVTLAWGMPFVASWFNLVPAGLMYRVAQGGLALVGGWAGRTMGLISQDTARIFAGYGLTFATIGLLQDWQLGLLTPPGPMATPGAALSGMGYEYATEPMGGSPYGSAYLGMGYYEAVGS